MYNLKQYYFKNYPVYIFLIILPLLMFSYFSIIKADNSYASRQLSGSIAAITIILVFSLIDYHQIIKLAIPIYLANFCLLVLVQIPGIGIEVNNARRWLEVGIRIQPSELSKIALVIFLAWYIEKYRDTLNTFRVLFKLCILIAIPLALVLVQPNLSTTIITFAMVCCIVFLGGLSLKIIAYIVAISVPLAITSLWYIQQPFQILLKDYQVQRILGFIDPGKYSQTFYQQENALVAIGSGQLFGSFQNQHITSLSEAGYLPESQTDFIFAIVGQEFGFFGCTVVILLLLALVGACFLIAAKSPSFSGTLLCCGIGAIIGIQSFLNIGVATALLPNTGVPLPFISYGLSSLYSLSIGIGIIINVGLQKSRFA